MAETLKYGIEVNTSSAVQNLQNLQNKISATSQAFEGIKGALGGLALGSTITSLFNYAAGVKDVADSSGIAIQTVLGLQKAVAANGGTAEGAQNSLFKFAQAIDGAAQGSQEAQDTFLKLGISLSDLGKLSQEDLLKKTYDGLAKLNDNSARVATSIKLFGKEMKTVDYAGAAADLQKYIDSQKEAAAAVVKLDNAERAFAKASGEFKTQLMIALTPLAELATSILKAEGAVSAFISSAIRIGTALAGLWALGKIVTLVEGFILAMRAATASTAGLTLSMQAAAGNTFANFLLGLKGITQAFNLSTAATVASYTGYSMLGITLKSLATGFIRMIPFIGQVVTGIILLDEAVKALTGTDLGGWFDNAAGGLEDLVTSLSPGLAKFINDIGSALGMAPPPSVVKKNKQEEADAKAAKEAADAKKKAQDEEAAKLREIEDAMKKQRSALDKIVEGYRMANAEANAKFQLDTASLTMTDKQKMKAQELFAATSKYNSQMQDLQDELKAKQESKSPSDQGMIPEIQKRMGALTEEYKKQVNAIDRNVEARIKAQRSESEYAFTTKTLTDNQMALRDVQGEIAKVFLPELEKKYKDLELVANRAAEGAIAEEEARRRQKLDPTEKERYYKIATQAIQEQKDALKELDKVQAAERLSLFSTRSLLDNQSKLRDLQLETAKVGLPALSQSYMDLGYAMGKSAEAAIQEEEARRGVKLDPAERQAYYDAAIQGVEGLTQAMADLNKAQEQYNVLQFGLKTQISLANDLQKIYDDMAKSGLSSIEQKYYDIEAAAKASAQAEIDAYKVRNGVDMPIDQQQEYYKKALEGVDKLKQAHKAMYDQGRTFASGWKSAFKSYIEDASNAANIAKNLFGKAMQGMEDLIVNFVKTGKFEWKNFVASMAEELLRSQIKQAFANIMSGMSSGTGILGQIGNLFGLGGADAGQPVGTSANNPMYVLDVSGGGNGFGGMAAQPSMFSGMSGASDIFNNPMMSGGGIGGGMSGVFDTISSVASNIGSFASDVVGSIGDFFGGFFAEGGTIPRGKFGIVGERGPEFVGGPATVTPMSGSTNVTYNINAVDAQSFKAMIAADPTFIYAVSMQGAKGIPGRF